MPRHIQPLLGGVVSLVGAAGLGGAALGAAAGSLTSMRPACAVALILAGAALFLATHRSALLAARVLGGAVASLALFALAVRVLPLWPEGPPDVMSAASALGFLDVACLLGFRPGARIRWALIAPLGFVSLWVLTGHLYGAESLDGVYPFPGTAILTAVGFLLLALAFACDPESGLAQAVEAGGPARVALRMLPTALAFPVALGLVWLMVVRSGLFGPVVALAMLTSLHVASAIVIVVSMYRKLRAESHAAERAARRFEQLVEGAPDAMVIVDTAGTLLLVNAQAETLFGYPREQLLGMQVEALLPSQHRVSHLKLRSDYAKAPAARAMAPGRSLSALRQDGTEVPIEITVSPLVTNDGLLFSASVRDVSARARAQAMMEAALKEKEALLSEVHHRVKNNLQVISSLIGMQALSLEPGTARSALDECQARVQAIALIHQKLYQTKDFGKVPFSEYAESLAQELVRTADPTGAAIELTFATKSVDLPLDRAIPCGLILNELVSNALKHAFPNRRAGAIRIELSESEGLVSLAVGDDGVGLQSGFEPDRATTLGMQLVTALAQQLGAKVSLPLGPGTKVLVTFAREAS